jgi:hypothetical protein
MDSWSYKGMTLIELYFMLTNYEGLDFNNGKNKKTFMENQES